MSEKEIKEIELKIKDQIYKLYQIKVDDSTKHLRDYGIDSLKVIDLILYMEEVFEMEIEDDYLTYDALSNVENITRLVIKIKYER